MYYLDVHTHLTHERFASDRQQVIQRAKDAGLGAIVVNGLEPQSNREILTMAQRDAIIKPALGIYPIDAVNKLLPDDFPHRVAKFDVDAEVAFIAEEARKKTIFAIGECGLDGYWIKEDTYAEQERVFEALIEIAKNNDLALIIHTRKREQRAVEILEHANVTKVDFHCFGGKTKLAQRCAEKHGWYFSIPANANRSEAFTKMLRSLPIEQVLTETDAPYLAPDPGKRNEPANVVGTVELFAKLRSLSVEDAKAQIWKNFCRLFGVKS